MIKILVTIGIMLLVVFAIGATITIDAINESTKLLRDC